MEAASIVNVIFRLGPWAENETELGIGDTVVLLSRIGAHVAFDVEPVIIAAYPGHAAKLLEPLHAVLIIDANAVFDYVVPACGR